MNSRVRARVLWALAIFCVFVFMVPRFGSIRSRQQAFLTESKRPVTIQSIRNSASRNCSKRHVYIDLGANMANSLEEWKKSDANSAGTVWEVYSFEPNPYLSDYTTRVAAHLSAPGGMSVSQALVKAGVEKPDALEKCITRHYKNEVEYSECEPLLLRWIKTVWPSRPQLPPPEDAYNTALQSADCSRTRNNKHTKYKVIPAGASIANQYLRMKWAWRHIINGGSNVMDIDTVDVRDVVEEMQVPLIDFTSWLLHSFYEDDYVFVKMDIEGAEYELLLKMLKFGALRVIDELCVEWHSRLLNNKHKEHENTLQWILESNNIRTCKWFR